MNQFKLAAITAAMTLMALSLWGCEQMGQSGSKQENAPASESGALQQSAPAPEAPGGGAEPSDSSPAPSQE